MAARFDDHFTMMAKDLGGCEAILDTFFGFLERRTEFYKYLVPGSKGGLPSGTHEQMIFSHYMKYREEYNRVHPPPPGVQAPTMEVRKPPSDEELARAAAEPLKPASSVSDATSEESKEIHVPALEKKDPEDSWVSAPSVPVDNSISTFNGAATDRYRWNQDIYTVQFQVKVPSGTRARDVKVIFEPKHIKVFLKANPDPAILEGELVERITPEDGVWLMDQDSVVVTMYKSKDVNWKGVLIGDTEIDPKTVDTTRRVDEYDPDTQAGLNKALSQQALNLAGRMTEEQEEQYKKMVAVMSNPNSPFKGQVPSPKQMFHLGPPRLPEDMDKE